MNKHSRNFARIPAVDEVVRRQASAPAIERFGRHAFVAAVRDSIGELREKLRAGKNVAVEPDAIVTEAIENLEIAARPNVRRVFNLTGTVLHTNLGRAVLADVAIEAATMAMRHALALEFDLATGKRGERDSLIRGLLCELTGAEDATIVNNNAAAVLLVLNTLAKGKQAVVSRGELIEIGGAFRMPDIMSRAGARLVEIGTTNRTHRQDYEGAVNDKTGLILKVHTSNYRIEGFTKGVSARDLATLAKARKIPLVHDLGSGTLVDLSPYGLLHEPTVAECVADGADVVSFSGDKLLGGPQAGFIVGSKELIARINRNPMKRALRLDKIRLAAIEATLRLYRDPDRLRERLPTLRMLARAKSDIEALAARLAPRISTVIGPAFKSEVVSCTSQIGSGALPSEQVASAGIACRAVNRRGSGKELLGLSDAFRNLPVPVIGRIADHALIFDLRCLEDEEGFVHNLAVLNVGQNS